MSLGTGSSTGVQPAYLEILRRIYSSSPSSIFMWVLGLELRVSDLCCKPLYPLSHLAGPLDVILHCWLLLLLFTEKYRLKKPHVAERGGARL